MHSIIIPAYNEELRIEKTLKDYTKVFRNGYEFIVVCDGIDKTANIVRNMQKKNKKIKVLTFDRRLGKGGAVYKGFDAARGSTIGFTDADEGVKPEEYAKLIDYLDNFDCVIASRRAKGARILRNRLWHIKIASYVFNKIVNLLFGLGIKDTQCGAKLLRRSAYRRVKRKLTLKGFEFDVDLLWRVESAGLSTKEVPITWKHDSRSKTNVSNHPNLLYQIIKLRLSR